ncbi:MAG: PKD domain-containing protein [Desulfobulbaceae bacterium]|nr:PKD domain-containing protein [Desulfobulbaceae bacterium]
MSRFLIALLLLQGAVSSAEHAQSAAELSAARHNYRYLIEQSYLKHPALPAGLLEAQAYVATRWQHRVPDDSVEHQGMPPVYGLFGLYSTNEYGFVDLLGDVAAFSGLSKDELMASEETYVFATAAWLEDQILAQGLQGGLIEDFAPVFATLSGIRDTSDASQYAVNSHVYEMYRTVGHGIDQDVIQITPQRVDLKKIFTADELARLGAKELVIDIAADDIKSQESKKKSASSSAGSSEAPEQVNVDYPGAIWREALYWSSRDGSAITHVVIHTMQGSYAGSINWFLNSDSQVSSHYLMRSSDGQITQMVRNADKAWHARSANAYTIGIEHEGFVDNPDWYTDVMYDESARLTAYVCNAYLIDCSRAYDGPSHSTVVELSNDFTVKGHQHYPEQVHSDPGINWDWPRYHSLINGGVIPPEVNFLPVASFVAECTGLTCSFDGTSSTDTDGMIASYTWNFGDGTGGQLSTISHSFASAGSYNVTLAVADDKGAIHETGAAVSAQSLPPPVKKKSGGGSISVWLLLLLAARAAVAQGGSGLELPALDEADYEWIASHIAENETGGEIRYLTYWGAGEDFPSFGIGHFIWFPAGVDAPFDETFPALVRFLREQQDIPEAPDWLRELVPFDAPWSGKLEFDEALMSTELSAMRRWLEATSAGQARFIVHSFKSRWNGLRLPAQDKSRLTELLQELLETPEGMFAVIDFYNFKGLGDNPRERYQGQGWGLAQVLGDIASQVGEEAEIDLVTRFSRAAAGRLRQRVALSPAERNEIRWLQGWQRRVAEYADESVPGTSRGFRITPYVQNPSEHAMTLIWFSEENSDGQADVGQCDSQERARYRSNPVAATALAFHPAELLSVDDPPPSTPYRHELRLRGLDPGQDYCYQVTQGEQRVSGRFHTPGTTVRFVVYGDSETEPESTNKHARWSAPDVDNSARRYLIDQTTGYAENIKVMLRRQPDFVAIAGDLVESGGEQRDWDEFWAHNSRLAASIPIIPALGNHDYYGGPGALGGYSNAATRRAIAKFKTYFDVPDNNAEDANYAESYYSLQYGPITLIVIDGNNGEPQKSPNDTNWYIQNAAEGGAAPAWNVGSPQFHWLQEVLESAQRESRFTFVVFHHAPYSSGVHGKPPGLAEGKNFASGLPLRALTPLFLRYGVDAVFNGHDEVYEHSKVSGVERLPDGRDVDHDVHFFVIGIGGDGLRGPNDAVDNPYYVFSADADAPELRDVNGILLDGGKHYGHLEVNVEQDSDGHWFARIEPVYVFPVIRADGGIDGFERRIYDDTTILGIASEH